MHNSYGPNNYVDRDQAMAVMIVGYHSTFCNSRFLVY